MLKLKNIRSIDGQISDWEVDSSSDRVIDGQGRLTLLPGVIDTHVHFRTPGHEYKEDWMTAASAAVRGGVTTVFDMPNNQPPCTTKAAFEQKTQMIDDQLKKAGIPLNYRLYFGATRDHFDEIGQVKDQIIGLKIYMGSSTGGLVMDDAEALDRAFQLAGQYDLLIAVHAEDEEILRRNQAQYQGKTDPATHSKLRCREAAIKAVKDAITLAQKYDTQLLVCHVSTREELDLIREAKQSELLVYAEATPHHLFLSEEDYGDWGTRVQVNPPLRTTDDQQALWEAVTDGTIDFYATDHAPHTLEEKLKPYGSCPSGIPSIELSLPLLLNACNEGRITLERLVEVTHMNAEQIFGLERNQDYVLVDMEKSQVVDDASLKTKCGWSPYLGRTLKGWPVYTILKGQVFTC